MTQTMTLFATKRMVRARTFEKLMRLSFPESKYADYANGNLLVKNIVTPMSDLNGNYLEGAWHGSQLIV